MYTNLKVVIRSSASFFLILLMYVHMCIFKKKKKTSSFSDLSNLLFKSPMIKIINAQTRNKKKTENKNYERN